MRPNPQETADLVTFTEDIVNGKLHFLCSVKKNVLDEALTEMGCDLKREHWILSVLRLG